jgi:hypothetical protein
MDTENLIKSLKDNRVRFVIIGATAFPVYGYVRATLDVDIFDKPDLPNIRRTMKALREFGFDRKLITTAVKWEDSSSGAKIRHVPEKANPILTI